MFLQKQQIFSVEKNNGYLSLHQAYNRMNSFLLLDIAFQSLQSDATAILTKLSITNRLHHCGILHCQYVSCCQVIKNYHQNKQHGFLLESLSYYQSPYYEPHSNYLQSYPQSCNNYYLQGQAGEIFLSFQVPYLVCL